MPRGIYPRRASPNQTGGIVADLERTASELEREAKKLRGWANVFRAAQRSPAAAPARRRGRKPGPKPKAAKTTS
jgi:hypothetical protein